MKRDPAVEQYCAEAIGWDNDRIAQSMRSARTAWRVAIAAAFLTLMSGIGLMLLLPLKSVQPYLIRVDNTTGIVDVVPHYTGTDDPGEAVTRYFLTQYVRVCESFDYDAAESDYEQCGAFNTTKLNHLWSARWSPSNPESPLNLYRDGTTLRARVKSVTFFKRFGSGLPLAQVRYVVGTRAGGNGNEKLAHWIATIEYTYQPPAKDERMRGWNPLGLRVVEFRREPELIETPAPVEGRAREATALAAGGSR